MAAPQTQAQIAKWHRWLGLVVSLPLLGWTVSSAVLVYTTFNLPNGLQGVFHLRPYNSVDVRLDEAKISPSALLKQLASEYGIERVHWLRVESRGPHLWYVVRPTPYSLAMTFDARSGRRLDPLSDELLALVANESLVGTTVVGMESVDEFNRDYALDRIPAVAATMAGEQPSLLILSRDGGRTLRRSDADSQRFNWWYRMFHVNQYGDDVIVWTAVLYLCAIGAIVATLLGYLLFWRRRKRAAPGSPSSSEPLSARNLHRKVGLAFGGVLVVQLAAGIYIWLSLGPLNPAFRGKPSFNDAWAAGISVDHELTDPAMVLKTANADLPTGPRPVQAIEWRKIGDHEVWCISSRRDERPITIDAATGTRIDALHPDVAGMLARQETAGQPNYDYLGPLHFSSMDLNRRLPAYRFRFRDAAATDVYVLQNTGEIVMRRPEFWRIFGPFLTTHMLAATKNKPINIALLAVFQLGFLAIILTGWRLQFPGRRSSKKRIARGGGDTKP